MCGRIHNQKLARLDSCRYVQHTVHKNPPEGLLRMATALYSLFRLKIQERILAWDLLPFLPAFQPTKLDKNWPPRVLLSLPCKRLIDMSSHMQTHPSAPSTAAPANSATALQHPMPHSPVRAQNFSRYAASATTNGIDLEGSEQTSRVDHAGSERAGGHVGVPQ